MYTLLAFLLICFLSACVSEANDPMPIAETTAGASDPEETTAEPAGDPAKTTGTAKETTSKETTSEKTDSGTEAPIDYTYLPTLPNGISHGHQSARAFPR